MDSTATFLASPVLFMGICALQGLRCSQSSVTSPVHYRAFVPACGSQVSLLKIYALRCSQLEVQRPHKTNIHEILECPSTIARRWANSKKPQKSAARSSRRLAVSRASPSSYRLPPGRAWFSLGSASPHANAYAAVALLVLRSFYSLPNGYV